MSGITGIVTKKGIKHLLVVDPSASHLAYVLLDIDFEKKDAGINTVGMIWCSDSWSKGRRYSYMRQAINILLNAQPLTEVVYTEAFFVNPKMMAGSAVVPVINGIIQLACHENRNIQFAEIPPPSWRAILGIKPTIGMVNGKKKKDFKVPTLKLVESLLGALPEQIISNVTGKMRDLPHDVSDVLAIALAVLKSHEVEKVQFYANTFYNKEILEKLKELNK